MGTCMRKQRAVARVHAQGTWNTHSTIRQIESSDLPTLVPPYFCTTHGVDSSAELRRSSSLAYESGLPDLDAMWVGGLILSVTWL